MEERKGKGLFLVQKKPDNLKIRVTQGGFSLILFISAQAAGYCPTAAADSAHFPPTSPLPFLLFPPLFLASNPRGFLHHHWWGFPQDFLGQNPAFSA